MKKVLLTKTKHIRVSTPDIIKKPLNASTMPPIKNASGVRPMHIQTNVITNTYMQRKSFQSIYEDIFKLLMRLPDKALQQRVIDAINGRSDKSVISNTNKCKQCSINEQKPQIVNASTQTELGNEEDSDAKITEKKPQRRGRKRNTCVPQVVKRSAAQMAMQEREDKQLTPLPPTKKKKSEEPSPCASPTPTKTSEMKRRDSVISNISSISYGLDGINFLEICSQVDNYINNDNKSTVTSIMANELFGAHIMSKEGLLPIHDAILGGDVQRVHRQIYVWSKLKAMKDLNELISEDGEDCLQLALTNNSEPEIVKTLLNAGQLPNYIYDNSNTALHIAVINNIHLESLSELMLKIDLNLLLQTNDDGYTALHIAVRHNRYKMAEIICDTIDQRELGAAIYQRALEESEETSQELCPKSMEIEEEKKFAKFYERICDRIEHNKEKLLPRRLKQQILNASETQAGNAALFYAVEGEQEHLCYFLLAHLTSPDKENHSGYSPKSFHYEFARVLRINLKISRIMDKVAAILNAPTR